MQQPGPANGIQSLGPQFPHQTAAISPAFPPPYGQPQSNGGFEAGNFQPQLMYVPHPQSGGDNSVASASGPVGLQVPVPEIGGFQPMAANADEATKGHAGPSRAFKKENQPETGQLPTNSNGNESREVKRKAHPNPAASNPAPIGLDPTASQFTYPTGFGPFDPAMAGAQEYALSGPWGAPMGGSYPLPLGPGCLGAEDVNLYGAGALMALPGQLHQYELEPYGVWPSAIGGTYYMNIPQPDQAKLLPPDSQYPNMPGTDAYGTANTAQQPSPFYGPLQPLPPSIDGSTFPSVSTLPPPPSQLASADQLYGLPNGFPPIGGHEAANNLGNGSSLLQLDHQSAPIGVGGQQTGGQFYVPQCSEMFTGQQQQPVDAAASKYPGNSNVSAPPASTRQTNGGGNPSTSGPVKRTRSHKSQLNAASRPSTAAGSSAERGGGHQSPPEKAASSLSGRKSRSRSLVKDSDDEKSTEEREAERRNANNTRERIRVRDINAAFKELAKLCSQHMPNVEERSLTKLGTLLKAVELIPLLEKKVEEKNRNMMNPRRECLKHRMEATASAETLGFTTSALLGIPGPSGLQAQPHFD